MKDLLGSNIVNVKAHNMQAVLLSLLNSAHVPGDSLSRIQLAHKTNLSSTTITNLINELIELGIVAENKMPQDDEQRSVGRPRTELYLISEARYVIGVHIGIGLYRIALLNLLAEMISSKIVNVSVDTPAEDVLQKISDDIQAILSASEINRAAVLGIGVGASGLVDYQNGVNILAPNLNWHNVPIRSFLEGKLSLPVVVENNVRAMALGEAYFGSGRDAQSLAFVYGRTGVGAGFVVNHELFRGSNVGAGEIGHTIMVPENGVLCRCGNRGCLETLVSEAVILKKAEEIAAFNPSGILARLKKQFGDSMTVETVFEAARQSDADALALMTDVGHSLGVALSNLVNILNPEMIILGGLFAQGEDILLPVIRKTLNQMVFAGLGEKVRLEITRFGWRAGVTGAAAVALLTFFYHHGTVSSAPALFSAT